MTIRLLVSTITALTLLAPTAPAEAKPGGTVRNSTPAKPLERSNPRYPLEARRQPSEAWTLASFVIRPDGTVGDILIDASFGGEEFEEAARAAMKKWRYEPARLDGENVHQCHQEVLLTYNIEDDGKVGASKRFIKRYEKASEHLDAGELDEAQEDIDRLEENNLYESVRASLLRAEVARIQGDAEGQKIHLWRTRIGDGAHLDDNTHAGVLRALFVLHVKSHDIHEAQRAYARLQKLDPEGGVPESMRESNGRIDKFLARDAPLQFPRVLPARREGETGYTRRRHGVMRNIIGIEDVEGSIDHVDLRCQYHRATWKPTPGKASRVPEKWGDCWLYVFGDPGTKFNVIEYDKSFASG